MAFATANGGTSWLANTGGTLSALSTYSTGNANYTATKNVDVSNGDAPVANSTVNTLRFNSAGIGLTLAGTNVINTGGLLVTPGSTGATISGGALTGGASGELVILDYGSLNIGSVIADNGSPTAVTLAGTGTTTFSNANNSYTGVTAIDGGTLILSGGSTGAGATTVNSGGTLQLASASANDGGLGSGTLTLNGGTVQATSAAALTLANAVSLTASSTISGAQSLTLGTVGETTSTTLTNNIAAGNTLTLGTVNIDASLATGLILTMNGSGNTIVTGAVQDVGTGTPTAFGTLSYSGSGTLTLAGVNTYGGPTTIYGGTVTLSGSNTVAGALTFAIGGAGGTFILNNTGAGAKSQNLGALTFQAGSDTVQTSATAGQNTLLHFSSMGTRTTGSTANFSVSGTPSASNGVVIAGQAAGFINSGVFFNGSNFAWYDSGLYVRGINYGTAGMGNGDAGAYLSTGGTTLPVDSAGATALLYAETTGAITQQATESFTTLNLAGTGTTAGQNDFTLASGATVTLRGILRSGNTADSSSTISGGAGIIASSGTELVVRTDGVNDSLTINTSIIGGTV